MYFSILILYINNLSKKYIESRFDCQFSKDTLYIKNFKKNLFIYIKIRSF